MATKAKTSTKAKRAAKTPKVKAPKVKKPEKGNPFMAVRVSTELLSAFGKHAAKRGLTVPAAVRELMERAIGGGK
jgi:hypothetical protein